MKNIRSIVFFISLFFFVGCQEKDSGTPSIQTVDLKMLDSIQKHSDSTYTKMYGRTDFVSAEYFISNSDGSITQVMRDSAKNIRQVIIQKNNRRVYFRQFYKNGQLMFKNKLDEFGQFDAEAEEYNENGSIKRSGIYRHGFHVGKWKNFDENGKYISISEYDENGQEKK